jgi:hypothetical protein
VRAATLVIVTVDGPDALEVADQIDLLLERLQLDPEGPKQFTWQIEREQAEREVCPWWK